MNLGNRGNSFSRSTFGRFRPNRIDLDNQKNKKNESDFFEFSDNFKKYDNFDDLNSNNFVNDWENVDLNNKNTNAIFDCQNQSFSKPNKFSQRLENLTFNNQSSNNSNISFTKCLNGKFYF